MTSAREATRLPLLNSYIDHWARERPDRPAMVQHEDGKTVSYGKLATLVDFFALRLLDMGIKPGDRVATMLITLPEHFVLMYACFKIGAIIAPLDMRLQNQEVVRDLLKIRPKAFFFLGDTPVRDFREVGRAVQKGCPSVEHLVQFTPDPKPGEVLDGAVAITEMMSKPRLVLLKLKNLLTRRLERAYEKIGPRTPALIIYTTGTTGEPKPAVLCHENILVQNEILARGMEAGPEEELRILNNLPPSHVASVTEITMTAVFLGGTTVMLRIFDVKATLEAIEKHRVTALGQIPTQFRMLWAHPEYGSYDLSSLQFVVYAGAAVDRDFLVKLSRMAPRFGTGIGMTENAGFATFTPPGISIDEMVGQVGRAFPDLAEVTIRAPMGEDGAAGAELPDGETGEICYHGPIVFLGYFGMDDQTAATVSKGGTLYTGDLGRFADRGEYRALILAGRRKFVIKQKGYNVYPDEVEAHISGLAGVDVAVVVGVKHKVYDEGIFAFVRLEEGAAVSSSELAGHCKGMASYKRPQHFEILPFDHELPLTRVAKVDKLELARMAAPIVEELRLGGGWDGHQGD